MEKFDADKFHIPGRTNASEDRSRGKDAQGGVVLHVTVKPGLPLGTFRQKIKINLNLDNNSVELPIEGNTVSDVEVAGASWDDDHSLLTLAL